MAVAFGFGGAFVLVAPFTLVSLMSLFKVVCNIIAQLASGTPVWKISIPAFLHEDLSAIEGLRRLYFHNAEALGQFNLIDSLEDPVRRLAHCLAGIIDPHINFFTDKPFNPILGEFIECSASVPHKLGECTSRTINEDITDDYSFAVELISHQPPIATLEINGPTFTITAGPAVIVDSSNGIRPGFNSVDVSFPKTVMTLKTTSGKQMDWQMCGYRCERLLTTNRSVDYFGPIEVRDASGYSFKGQIKMGAIISGSVIDFNGQVVNSVAGDARNGLMIDGTTMCWMKPINHTPLDLKHTQEVLDHPLVYKN